MENKLKSALSGGVFTFFIDMFDIYLPIIVLAPALAYFEPSNLKPVYLFALTYATLAATLLGRPIGTVLFGNYADKKGRKSATQKSVIMASVFTFLILILPGYSLLGLVSISLLLVFRFFVGIFLGGMYTGASPLAMEYSPKSKRGVYGAILNIGYPFAFAAISLISLPLLFEFPATSSTSTYEVWIWRIPFAIETILLVILYIYYRKIVPESEIWEESKKVKSPISEILFGSQSKQFWQVFILMTGFWFGLLTIVSSIGSISESFVKISATTYLLYISISAIIGGFLLIPWGMLSQKIGRKKVLVIGGLLFIIGVPFFYAFINYGKGWGLIGVFFAILLLWIISDIGFSGTVTAYITERFKTSTRSSGFGMGYTWGVLIPSFNSFFIIGLSYVMPAKYAETLPLLFIGGVLVIAGALLGPETKDVDFDKNA
ncbi:MULTISPECIES: MFS transporter [unclassified Acidiplasma]|nr:MULTISPECIES: MFS transporter [unclassified Acidiplasma]WMT55302.1 MAG: MFS transporter [Acidiplasma sp.]